ncbi:hypothetical protein A1C_05290 [Rickettsia akari str. Hartford]|uniref:Nucleotidyl transferase domain-containing protein n=1 Tax=Rickettsia akari (strain Hartford) TaxID=293614 RepID=A8GPI3_RICAH|nr:sugar phosphate nucleotidyltransferase [Rickettsia akari]ABV75308.1 hypothetical protein A1C_05290 [Rickettsia akari str. Hartford]
MNVLDIFLKLFINLPIVYSIIVKYIIIKPVIIADGSGKRLWSLSSKEKPKQFKKILSNLTLTTANIN